MNTITDKRDKKVKQQIIIFFSEARKKATDKIEINSPLMFA